jgi:uncharacterized RDD family membrane protein YckC
MNAPNPYAPPLAELSPPPGVNISMLADRGSRLGASLLDGLLFFAASLVMLVMIALSGSLQRKGSAGPSSDLMEMVVLIGFGFVPLVAFLSFQAYRLSTTGQTLGKRWVGIRVIKMDGTPVNFVSAVLMRVIVPTLLGAVPLVGAFFSLADVLFIFRDDRRCLHDLIATTKVVRA